MIERTGEPVEPAAVREGLAAWKPSESEEPSRPASLTDLPVDPATWVEAYGDDLYRYAWSRLRDDHAAEEVVQETFLAGLRFAHQHEGTGTIRAWLMGILKRKIVDHVRRRLRREREGSFGDEVDAELAWFDAAGNWSDRLGRWLQPPDAAMQSRELWEIVRECLTHLPRGQADVFTLSVMEGMESERICEELGITPANFWVRLHRARLGLARCVGARWFGNQEGRGDAERS